VSKAVESKATRPVPGLKKTIRSKRDVNSVELRQLAKIITMGQLALAVPRVQSKAV